jgi:hypothetical protein
MESFALVGREYPRSDTSFLSPAEATHTPMAPKNCGMKFKVDYGTNWDGGRQERDKAVSLVREVFPDASVEAKSKMDNGVTISISEPIRAVVATCAQRDLFSKYNWPAAPDITKKLMALKETLDEDDWRRSRLWIFIL